MGKNKFYYGWWVVLSGFLIMAIAYASIVSCQGLFIIPVTEELGVSRVAFSTTTACLALGLVIGSLFTGTLIKKYGLKKIMCISCVIITICLIGFSFAQAMWQFYALGITMGIAFPGLTNIAVSIMINNWFGKKKKGFAMSLVFAGSGVGGMILMVVLNQLIQGIGWRQAYAVNALAIFIVLMPFIWFVIKETPSEKGLNRLGDATETNGSAEKEEVDAKWQKKFGILFISVFLMCVANNAILNHQVPYFREVGFSVDKAAAYAAVALGALTIGKVVLGIIFDKLGIQKGALVANLMLVLAVIALLILAKMNIFIYFYIVFYGVGAAAATVSPPLLTGSVVPEKYYAKYVGLINVATGLGAIVGAMFCAKLYDLYNQYSFAWKVLVITAAIIIPLQMVALHKKQVNMQKNEEKPLETSATTTNV
ncbi:MAG: MFS transporter [Lachnospiraceae bacterium]